MWREQISRCPHLARKSAQHIAKHLSLTHCIREWLLVWDLHWSVHQKQPRWSLKGSVPARNGRPGGMHAFNHTSASASPHFSVFTNHNPSFAEWKRKVWGYARWFSALHLTMWHLDHEKGPELLVRIHFWPTSHRIEHPSIGMNYWLRRNQIGGHSVLWFVSLLMVFCFHPWQRTRQPANEG